MAKKYTIDVKELADRLEDLSDAARIGASRIVDFSRQTVNGVKDVIADTKAVIAAANIIDQEVNQLEKSNVGVGLAVEECTASIISNLKELKVDLIKTTVNCRPLVLATIQVLEQQKEDILAEACDLLVKKVMPARFDEAIDVCKQVLDVLE